MLDLRRMPLNTDYKINAKGMTKVPDYSKLSPMMQQYVKTKEEYPDHILFYRLGDFYEMFFDDALTASRELEITLTGKDCGLESRAPMCGVPHHSAELYIKKLIEKGYRVAICEQTEDPALAKGLVKREVVRIMTPGTVVEASMLDEGRNNYICSIYCAKKSVTAAFADISTGNVEVFLKSGPLADGGVTAELSRFMPSEILYNSELLSRKPITEFIKIHLPDCVSVLRDDESFVCSDMETVFAQLDTQMVQMPEFDAESDLYKCLYSLFDYIKETQKSLIKRFTSVNIHSGEDFLTLDYSARRNLELTETMITKEKKGSLLWVLDKTSTAMGRRLLKAYIEQPLTNVTAITKRQNAVEQLVNSPIEREEIEKSLEKVYDLERLMSRVMYGTATPRDVRALAFTAEQIPSVKENLKKFSSGLLHEIDNETDELSDIRNLVENAVEDEPPVTVKDGGVIKQGFNSELDELRKLITGGKDILAEIEASEREKTGIRSLKVGYNKVFGYYIEVSKSFTSQVPDTYIRKQTLTNGERYITQELKDIENKILSANDKSLKLEAEIFAEVKKYIASKLTTVQQTAAALAKLDVFCSLAKTAVTNSYTRPVITLDGVIDIKDGRHPVIEAIQRDEMFVPNDIYLDKSSSKMIILTGPNMAGKSTYMRQTALIVLMAQIGSFVPASDAKIGVVDKIFTRIGASDDLASGKSTFMVEMSEVADILNQATKDSLVILDEIGRGTSTYDGMSIASAVVEHIVTSKKLGCKTLFATHYHELIELENKFSGVKNFNIAAAKKGDTIKFLRKIVRGGADDSYGIEVAKLAGVPKSVTDRAKEILTALEKDIALNQNIKEVEAKNRQTQVSLEQLSENEAIKRLRKIDPDDYSPREAHEILRELVELV